MPYDAVALFCGEPRNMRTMVDFVVWREGTQRAKGKYVRMAEQAGLWLDAAAPFRPLVVDSLLMQRPVMQGDSIGRDSLSSNTHAAQDWAGLGGADASGPTPGQRNVDDIFLQMQADDSAAGPARRARRNDPEPLARRRWTIMSLIDMRDK